MLEAHQESRKANLRATMEVINRSRDLLKTHGGALDCLVSRRDLGDLDEESLESSQLSHALIDDEDPTGGEDDEPVRRHSNVEFSLDGDEFTQLDALLHDDAAPPPTADASSKCTTPGGGLDAGKLLLHDVGAHSVAELRDMEAHLLAPAPAPDAAAPALPRLVPEAAAASR